MHLSSELESHKRGIRVRVSAAGIELVSAPEAAPVYWAYT